MNSGTFISTLSIGFIQSAWGWHACFATAAVGMLIGIIIFTSNFKRFGDKGLPARLDLVKGKRFLFTFWSVLSGIAVIVVCHFLLLHTSLGNKILLTIAAIVFIYLIMLILRFQGQERRNLIALVWLLLFAVVFWAIFFEIFSVVSLFIENNVNRTVFNITIPPIAFISLEAIFIVILGVPLAMLWKYLHHRQSSIPIAIKFVLALFLLALAMHLLTYAIADHNAQYLVLPIWMVFFYLLITLGEMLLSPNILSAISELSREKSWES